MRNGLCYFLALLITYELLLGGGGRLVDFGFLSPRMVLFSVAVLLSLYYLIYNRSENKDVIIFFFAFLVYVLWSALIGSISGYSLTNILTDLKPISFFLLVFFISQNTYFSNNLFKGIKISSVILSLVYLFVWFLMRFNIIPFETIYSINETGEFYFRGDSGFVYKGFIFVLLGALLFFIEARVRRTSVFFLLVCLLAMYLTYSRGFIVTFVLSCSIILAINNRLSSKVILSGCVLAIPILLYEYLYTITDRAGSDSFRINDLLLIAQYFDNYYNIFIGSGFGAEINGRSQIEYSLLEILYKSGVVGLLFWIGIYVYIAAGCLLRFNEKGFKFFILTTAIYLQSSFNPYMNNPMGIFIIMVSLVHFSKARN